MQSMNQKMLSVAANVTCINNFGHANSLSVHSMDTKLGCEVFGKDAGREGKCHLTCSVQYATE